MTLWRRLLTIALLTGIAGSSARAGTQRGADAPPAADALVQAKPGDVTVHHEPPQVQTKTFDPANPPPEMPPLKPGEAAVTESSFSCQTMIGVLVTSQQPGVGTCRATVKITSVTTTLRLGIVIWLPQQGARKLTAHEEGHRIIDERYYAGASEIAERLSRAMIGDEVTAEGSDCDAAAQAAIRNAGNELCGQYMAAVQFPAARAQVVYDQLTDHGRNEMGEKQAIAAAMKKQREEQRAGTQPTVSPNTDVHHRDVHQ
jgi:hypothetical protein